MERWIERGPEDSDEIEIEKPRKGPDEGILKVKIRRSSHYAIPEGIMRPNEPFSDDGGTGSGSGKPVPNRYAEKREREERLCVLQGLLLFAIYALFSSDKEKHKKGRNLLARCVEVSFGSLLLMHSLSLAPPFHTMSRIS